MQDIITQCNGRFIFQSIEGSTNKYLIGELIVNNKTVSQMLIDNQLASEARHYNTGISILFLNII